MALIEDLRQEHTHIEQVLGALRTWLEGAGPRAPADGQAFRAFLVHYAGHFHHAREEDVLFPALVRECDLPDARGPLAVLRAEHQRMAVLLGELGPGLASPPAEPAALDALRALAAGYTEALLHHLDAENSVLLPEAEERLRRAHVPVLEGRGPGAEEAGALAAGLELTRRFPPTFDRGVLRSEGCVGCAAYGVSCEGLEREWWNESEWEEAPGRAANG